MLIRIQCDKFMSNGVVRPPIEFHPGLNAVLGDENRLNSIGKSTLLMIIDFVFGGDDYVNKCLDVQNNVKDHTINFTLRFDGKDYHFARNTIDYRYIIPCDENYDPIEGTDKIHIDSYKEFLADKYHVGTEGISWRGAMSKFIRVYKRDTMDESFPLQSAKQEAKKDAIKKYMQQFGRYAVVDEQIKQADEAVEERDAFKKTRDANHIRSARTAAEYKENEEIAARLEIQERELAESSSEGLMDLDTVQAKRINELNDLLLSYRRQRARVQTQLNSLRREMIEGKKSFKRTFSDLEKYFPNEEFRALEEVESFHQGLSKVLKSEFAETEKDLGAMYIMLGNEIVQIKDQIKEIQDIPNVTQAILQEYARITTALNNVREANKNYDVYEQLKETAKAYAETRDKVIAIQLSDIESIINDKMREITTRIVKNEIQRSPELKLEKLGSYHFSTPDDGGSGAQNRGLVTFDLANMEVLNIPFIVHDADLLDPVEKPALTEIIKEYDAVAERGQQVFATFRSMEFYDPEAQPIIERNKVLSLSGVDNGQLFGRGWNKEPIKEDEEDKEE